MDLQPLTPAPAVEHVSERSIGKEAYAAAEIDAIAARPPGAFVSASSHRLSVAAAYHDRRARLALQVDRNLEPEPSGGAEDGGGGGEGEGAGAGGEGAAPPGPLRRLGVLLKTELEWALPALLKKPASELKKVNKTTLVKEALPLLLRACSHRMLNPRLLAGTGHRVPYEQRVGSTPAFASVEGEGEVMVRVRLGPRPALYSFGVGLWEHIFAYTDGGAVPELDPATREGMLRALAPRHAELRWRALAEYNSSKPYKMPNSAIFERTMKNAYLNAGRPTNGSFVIAEPGGREVLVGIDDDHAFHNLATSIRSQADPKLGEPSPLLSLPHLREAALALLPGDEKDLQVDIWHTGADAHSHAVSKVSICSLAMVDSLLKLGYYEDAVALSIFGRAWEAVACKGLSSETRVERLDHLEQLIYRAMGPTLFAHGTSSVHPGWTRGVTTRGLLNMLNNAQVRKVYLQRLHAHERESQHDSARGSRFCENHFSTVAGDGKGGKVVGTEMWPRLMQLDVVDVIKGMDEEVRGFHVRQSKRKRKDSDMRTADWNDGTFETDPAVRPRWWADLLARARGYTKRHASIRDLNSVA